MNKTIRVTGKGTIKIRPDMIRLTISLTGTAKEYSDTIRRSADDTEILKNTVEKLGFRRTDLKTLSFDVDTRYESYRDKNNDYHQRFVGYEYSHVFKLEFQMDNDLLGKVLFALAHAPVHPEFRINYTVKDPESTKNELLGKAVADAIAKATVLSQSANVKLKSILSIDYSWGEIDLDVRMQPKLLMDVAPMYAGESCNIDVEPEDIEAGDTVTIIWEIE